MRIELTLENNGRETVIPLNYNHSLAACIYQTLATSSTDYSERLHESGYAFQGKGFKPFTFSQLLSERRRIEGDQLFIQSPTLRWLISSPVDEFALHLANGILERGVVRVGSVNFRVREVNALPNPEFTSSMRFTCLSPISVSTHIDVDGLNSLQYCRLDNGFYEKVIENLKRKHALVNSLNPSVEIGHARDNDLQLSLEFDPSYIDRRGGKIHKLVQYKNTKIFAYLAPFIATGSSDLIRIGYECGFGDGNSKGLGMVDVDRKREGRR